MELREKIIEIVMREVIDRDYFRFEAAADAILAIPEIAEALKVHAGQKALAEEYRSRRIGNVWQPVFPDTQ